MKYLLIIFLFIGYRASAQVVTRVVLSKDTTAAPAGVRKVTLITDATTPGAGITKATLVYDAIPGAFMYFFPFKLN